MLGWELPPYNSGGLGTASLGMTQGLSSIGVGVRFVVPKVFGAFPFSHMPVLSAADHGESLPWDETAGRQLGYHTELLEIDGQLLALPSKGQLTATQQSDWYAEKVLAIAENEPAPRLIHTHDWMTYRAGMAARDAFHARGFHAPMVAHIHATEFDRSSTHGNPEIYALEKEGLNSADRVVAVSQLTADVVHHEYGVPNEKIRVVHNGHTTRKNLKRHSHPLKGRHPVVLFMGRVTWQKGPEHFLRFAQALLKTDPSVRFIFAGSGDQYEQIIEQAAGSQLSGRVLFAPFLRGEEVDRAYQLADLFVMPSESEPFGLVALEAMEHGTPVLASPRCGVNEVASSIVVADHTNPAAMAKAAHKLLNHSNPAALQAAMQQDLLANTWEVACHKLQAVYDELTAPALTPVLVRA